MKTIRPELKRLTSSDVYDLESYRPPEEDCFGFLVRAIFGPENSKGEESFDMIVCTPRWLEQKLEECDVISGRHYLIVSRYDIETIRRFLIQYAQQCSGETWHDVAVKLSRIGQWEFEDYVPYASPQSLEKK
jgi:hypothetical protein